MVTRLKPQRVKSSNSPQVGQNLGYEDSNNFKWQNTGSGVGDMKYSDFEWKTLSGNAITIEDISNNITPSSNFTVSAGTVKPGIEYILRVNTGNTAYTMTLGTGIINPNGYNTELKPNTVNQFKFIATSTTQLELEGIDVGDKIEYVTQAEYNALLPGAESDGKHYFIYSTSGGGGWQPGVNTLLYLPLNSIDTHTDKSGNNISTTNNGVVFGTYQGVDCGYFNSTYIDIDTVNMPITYTILAWCYNIGINQKNTDGKIITSLNNPDYALMYSMYAGGKYSFNFLNATNPGPQNTRVLVVGTNDSNGKNFYLKGANLDDYTTNNASLNLGTSKFRIGGNSVLQYNRFFLGGISNVIIENKVRTAQEISDYYNQTKGDYGIS